jgi:hypothetical protein
MVEAIQFEHRFIVEKEAEPRSHRRGSMADEKIGCRSELLERSKEARGMRLSDGQCLELTYPPRHGGSGRLEDRYSVPRPHVDIHTDYA